MRVLVVDDNDDIVLTMVELLTAIGHESMGCYNGEEAVECVREYDPDVVIMDIGMPVKSGWQAAQEIRAEHGRRPVLIAVSGEYTKGSDKVLSKIKGFDYHLTKPVDPKALVALMEKAAVPSQS